MKLTNNSLRLVAATFCTASTLFLTPASYAGTRHVNLNHLERGEKGKADASRDHKNSKEDSKDSKDSSSDKGDR